MLEPRAGSLPRSERQSRAAVLALALVVTVAARAIPAWSVLLTLWRDELGGEATLSYELFHDLVLLAMGLGLALSAPRRSGLTLGSVRAHWRGVLIVCGGPVLVTAAVYPMLPERPFTGASWSLWAVSPLAQDLVFIGYLYGRLARAFPGPVHPRLPWSRALLVTAMFFAIWHVPNLSSIMSAGYVGFQLAYAAVGLAIVGLSRQWTGSILYAWLTHAAVNAIAWAT
jgi:membrane protease YdiL (CAAX protease family)